MSLFGLIRGFRSSDSTAQPARIDKATNALEVIEYQHHEIHDGDHYFYGDSLTLASAATQDYLITVPNTAKWPHILFDLDGLGITQFDLYEGSDKTGTTSQTARNNNRNSGNTAGMTIHKGTSGGTTDGTLIRSYKSGSTSAIAKSLSLARSDEEYILKQNTKYILRVTSGSNDNLINIKMVWYEHTSIA